MAAIDEDSLNAVAKNGQMDYDKWPAILEPLLDRLNHIVYNDFSMPQPYPTANAGLERPSSATDTPVHPSTTTQVTQTPTTPRQLPPVPPFPGSSASDASTSHVPNSQPDQTVTGHVEDRSIPELPTILLQLLNSITHTLRTSFLSRPPHTIQRLSELILDPRAHYKTLPAWLRAVDRVVSVSSTADIFPLFDTPAMVNGVNGDGGGGILWGNSNTDTRNGNSGGYDPKDRDGGLGSDESLGGALLTPIPWLRNISHDDTGSDLEGTGAGSDGQGAEDFLDEPIHLLATPETSPVSTSSSAHPLHTPASSAADNDADAEDASSMAVALPRNSDPLVPERPSGAVTQGELIRMEQEAGVVPVGPTGISGSSSPPMLHRSSIHSDGPPSSIALGVGVGLAGDPTTPQNSKGIDQDIKEEQLAAINEGLPHARGPDVVGTVDMGLVGGKGVEVRIGSPPADHRVGMDKVDPNDAQDVLAGGHSTLKQDRDNNGINSSSSSSEAFIHVSGSGESDADAMQVDKIDDELDPITANREGGNQSQSQKKMEDFGADSKQNQVEDEDMILVDADGLTQEQRDQVDASELNVGNDTADGTGL